MEPSLSPQPLEICEAMLEEEADKKTEMICSCSVECDCINITEEEQKLLDEKYKEVIYEMTEEEEMEEAKNFEGDGSDVGIFGYSFTELAAAYHRYSGTVEPTNTLVNSMTENKPLPTSQPLETLSFHQYSETVEPTNTLVNSMADNKLIPASQPVETLSFSQAVDLETQKLLFEDIDAYLDF